MCKEKEQAGDREGDEEDSRLMQGKQFDSFYVEKCR